jgi:DNA-binding transcriptional LysR family regulator
VVLERHEFDAFLTLSEELHFGRTAERLRVSTARVSQTIRKLERQVGSPLFIRTSRRVELTAVGRQLYDDLRPARNMIDTAMQRAIDAGRGFTGTLRAGFLTAAVLAVPSGECLARGPHAPEATPATGDAAGILAYRQRAGLDPGRTADRPGPTAATLQELLSLVGIGRGACLVGAHTRRYYVRPDVVYRPIRDAPPVRWGLVWLAGAGTARVRAFEQAAREVRERDK